LIIASFRLISNFIKVRTLAARLDNGRGCEGAESWSSMSVGENEPTTEVTVMKGGRALWIAFWLASVALSGVVGLYIGRGEDFDHYRQIAEATITNLTCELVKARQP
jgi:hypothetical protein